MTDTWESTPGDLGAALPEVTNQPLPGPPRDAAKAQIAQDKGWAAPTDFDYGATIPPLPSHQADGAAATNGNAPPAIDFNANEELPGWMSRARKYEWNDDYGDTAPEIPELEKELFGSELRMRPGTRFDL